MALHMVTLLATMSLCHKCTPGCSNVTSPSVSPIKQRGDIAAGIFPSPLSTYPCFQEVLLNVQKHMGLRPTRGKSLCFTYSHVP